MSQGIIPKLAMNRTSYIAVGLKTLLLNPLKHIFDKEGNKKVYLLP